MKRGRSIEWDSDENVKTAVHEYLDWLCRIPRPRASAHVSELHDMKHELQAAILRRDRWQAQVFLHGPSLLQVLSTRLYNEIIIELLHPERGLEGERMKPEQYSTVPLMLPASMQPSSLGDISRLSECLRRLHRAQAELDASERADHLLKEKAFLEDASQRLGGRAWARWGLPAPEDVTHLPLSALCPRARAGQLLIWNGNMFHGTQPSEEPSLTAFVDVAPRQLIAPSLRYKMWRRHLAGPFEFGGGRSRHEGWNAAYAASPSGRRRATVPMDPLTCFLHGDDSVSEAVVSDLEPLLSAEKVGSIKESGYAIIDVEGLLKPEDAAEWRSIISALQEESMHYVNWILFGSQGFEKSLDLSQTDAPVWKLLRGGRKEAREQLGDEWALYVERSDGTRVHNAQNGGIRLSADSGMGPATNAYDLAAQWRLRSFPPLVALLRDIYGEEHLLAVPERFRLKAGQSRLALHIDVLPGAEEYIDVI